MARSGNSPKASAAGKQSPAATFVLGAVVGGLAGAVVGAMLGKHSGGAATSLVNTVDKLAGRNPEDRPRFELLLQ